MNGRDTIINVEVRWAYHVNYVFRAITRIVIVFHFCCNVSHALGTNYSRSINCIWNVLIKHDQRTIILQNTKI